MRKVNTMRLPAAVLSVAALILIAGGAAIASNMGFKLNYPLSKFTTGPSGQNWVSIPYFNPYTTGCTGAGLPNCAGAFCAATGLPNLVSTIQFVDPATGTPTTFTCGTAAANTLRLIPGQGYRILSGNNALPASIIIVGSHDPTASVGVPRISTTSGFPGNKWFAVPYHTTATNAQDLCVQMGRPSLPANVQNLDPTTGATTTPTCGTAAATAMTLVLGRAYRLRSGLSTADISFIPAHY